MQSKSYVIGLDLSLNGTGLCVLDGEGNIALSTCIKNKAKLSGFDRIIAVREKVISIIKEYQPTLIAIEGYSMGQKAGVHFDTVELSGQIKVWLYQTGYKFCLVPPTTLKKFITGKGNSKKNVMLMEILSRWGIKFLSDDEGDAYGLSVVAAYEDYFLGNRECPKKITHAMRESLSALSIIQNESTPVRKRERESQ